jgi:hypothetical protein
MRNPVLQAVVWLVCAVALLLVGLFVVVYAVWTAGHALGVMRDIAFNFALMTFVVTLAALLPRLLIPALRPAGQELDPRCAEAE